MGELLTFATGSRPALRPQATPPHGGSAEIVIFPGIRIERHETPCALASGVKPRPAGKVPRAPRPRRPAR